MAGAPPPPPRSRFARWLSGGTSGAPDATASEIAALRESLAATEAALDEARRGADRAQAARRDFLAAANHELRTPLNAILGFGQVLEMSLLSAEQRECVRQVLKGGRHLLALVNELIELSQLDAGSLALSPEPVGVRELLVEVRDLVQPLASARGLTLDVETPAGPVWVRADRHRLQQVLLNLLTNAIKFNHPRGRVVLRAAAPEAGRVRIAVSDTGPGLSAEQIARLFAPFERLDAEHHGIDGTGLGLTLCRGLVQRMDGAIGIDSTRGQGATVWVELPATAEVALPTGPDVRPDAAPGSASPPAPGVVLHIEDNSTNLRLIERLLAGRPGVRLLAAMQGRLGLTLAHEHQPALILLDLNLPDTHGLDLLQRLAADSRTARIPVLVITADATPGTRRRAAALGARQVLAKPLDVPQFLALVDTLLGPTEGNACRPA
jgi:signal transduction histidine kinase/CheY-like chemotaxis protein